MNYHNITKDDMLNGDGLRVVLWVAGCKHYCPQCQNPVTWDPEGGLPFGEKEIEEIFVELEHDYCSGITYTGGDPLYPWNRVEISLLAEQIRQRYPDKTQWLYTGYSWDEIKDLRVIKYLDVVKTGEFSMEQRLIDKSIGYIPEWRGDSSQELRRKINGEWVLTNDGHWNENIAGAHGKECGCN